MSTAPEELTKRARYNLAGSTLPLPNVLPSDARVAEVHSGDMHRAMSSTVPSQLKSTPQNSHRRGERVETREKLTGVRHQAESRTSRRVAHDSTSHTKWTSRHSTKQPVKSHAGLNSMEHERSQGSIKAETSSTIELLKQTSNAIVSNSVGAE